MTDDELIGRAQEAVELFEGSALADVIDELIKRVIRAESGPTPEEVKEEAKRLFPDTEPLALALAMREVFERGANFKGNWVPPVQEIPVAVATGYTTHGHAIPGLIQKDRPESVARCGGPTFCGTCREEASPYLPWHHTLARPYFVGNDEWCRHPLCESTDWQGNDRVHLRDPGCPEVDYGTWVKNLVSTHKMEITRKSGD